MRLDDPARPRQGPNGPPCYCKPDGTAIAPLQSLNFSLFPEEEANFVYSLFAMWCFASNRAKYFTCRVSLCQELEGWAPRLETVMAEFQQDPEETMRERFGWSWQEQAKPQPPAALAVSLEELGL